MKKKEERRIIKEAWRFDSGISSFDIITVVCEVRTFSFLRVQGSLHLCEDLQETLHLGQTCAKTSAVNVSENVFEML